MVITVGSANLDIIGRIEGPVIQNTSNPGQIYQSFGGVGFNIVRNLALLNLSGIQFQTTPVDTPIESLAFVGVLGDDQAGREMMNWLETHQVDTRGVRIVKGLESSRYMEILDQKGDLVLGLSHMDQTKHLDSGWLSNHLEFLRSATWIVAECNLSLEALEFLGCEKGQAKLMIEGVSTTKVQRIKNLLPQIDLLKVNRLEAYALLGIEENNQIEPSKVGKKLVTELLHQGLAGVILTMGKSGAWYGTRELIQFIPSVTELNQEPDPRATLTGAGDSFSAGFVWALSGGATCGEAGRLASQVAAITCLSSEPVHPDLPLKLIDY